jgi:hypothetical protein
VALIQPAWNSATGKGRSKVWEQLLESEAKKQLKGTI